MMNVEFTVKFRSSADLNSALMNLSDRFDTNRYSVIHRGGLVYTFVSHFETIAFPAAAVYSFYISVRQLDPFFFNFTSDYEGKQTSSSAELLNDVNVTGGWTVDGVDVRREPTG